MRNKMFLVGMIVVLGGLMTFAGWAQNRSPQRGAGQNAAAAVTTNAEIILLSGNVSGINFAAGQGMPSLRLTTSAGEVTIMLGPYRAFADSKLEITLGSPLQIKAFADPRFANAYVAVEITDAKGTTIVLRDAAGMPSRGMGQGMMRGAMQGGQGGRGMHGMQGGQGMHLGTCAYMQTPLDTRNRRTLTGAVVSVDMEPGKGSPSFVMAAGTIIACPYHALLQAGFQIAVGDNLTVVAYPVPGETGMYLAAEISNGTKKVTLRDENGVPLRTPGACAGTCR